MYKLYGMDGSEKIVKTNTDRREHIKSGFYSEKSNKVSDMEMKKESVKEEVTKKSHDLRIKPKRRRGI